MKRNVITSKTLACNRKRLAEAFDVEIETLYHRLPGAVVNDEKLTEDAKEVAKSVGYNVSVMDQPLTIGEDFSVSQINIQVYLYLLVLIVI